MMETYSNSRCGLGRLNKRSPLVDRSRSISSSSLLVILLFTFLAVQCGATPSEGDILKSMANHWNVSFPTWKGVRPCHHHWTGVTCDTLDGHVISLALPNVTLGNTIPPQIGQLSYLQRLDLFNTSLNGTIPPEIGQLTHLTMLNLSTNELLGPIPEAITLCTNLSTIILRVNKLGGQLPVFLNKLTNLQHLDLHKNNIWGGLPPEWGSMKAMQSMQLWENDLSGYIPASWSNMTNMVNFGMGQLYLTGTVPDWLFNLPKLKVLNIPKNQFVGNFPTNIPANSSGWTNYTQSQLDCNFFTGAFPLYVPKPITYGNNCYTNETDGDPQANHDGASATEYTKKSCTRDLTCQMFLLLVNQSNDPNHCAPCPATSPYLVDPSTCVCGKVAPHSNAFPIGGVVGGVAGVVAILLAVVCLLLYKQKLDAQKNKYSKFGRQFEGINDPWEVPKEIRRFTLQELEKATQHFNDAHSIGQGGFGIVYRGTLEDGRVVAIKCASLQSTQGQAEFRNELKLLSRLHHRNLVILEGFCDDQGYQILVYEFLVNGNLKTNLVGPEKGPEKEAVTGSEKEAVSSGSEKEAAQLESGLTAYQRLEVAVGIARGIEYLHSFASPPVIHRDVKPSNVLLDEHMVAKLSDFGISKVSAETHISTRALGTAGYLDPEYYTRHQLTTGSDVYSYGVVLLELVTGQEVIDYSRGTDEFNIIEWVTPRYAAGGVAAIVDRRLGDKYDPAMYKDMTDVALQCTTYDRTLRPTMKAVLTALEPHVKVPSVRRSNSYGWSRSRPFNLSESNFTADVENPPIHDLTRSLADGDHTASFGLHRLPSSAGDTRPHSRDFDVEVEPLHRLPSNAGDTRPHSRDFDVEVEPR